MIYVFEGNKSFKTFNIVTFTRVCTCNSIIVEL